MLQQGQVFRLKGGTDEASCWAYRHRVGGRDSRRVQRGGFASERDATEALERALERLRRARLWQRADACRACRRVSGSARRRAGDD
jgi:hypothetical protein